MALDGNSKAFVLTFLGGAVAGAIGGLLFAPQSGRESRAQISKYAEQVGESYKEAVAKGKELVQRQKTVLADVPRTEPSHDERIKKAS